MGFFFVKVFFFIQIWVFIKDIGDVFERGIFSFWEEEVQYDEFDNDLIYKDWVELLLDILKINGYGKS